MTKKQNTDKEMADLERQIEKADLEITVPKHELEVDAWPSVNCINSLNNIKN